MQNIIRLSLATPSIKVSEPLYNAKQIISLILQADEKACDIILFPELCLTSASCQDLFLYPSLWTEVLQAFKEILEKTKQTSIVIHLGMPISLDGLLFNCMLTFSQGNILHCLYKKKLSLEESLYFCSTSPENEVNLFDQSIPFSDNFSYSYNQQAIELQFKQKLSQAHAALLLLVGNTKTQMDQNIFSQIESISESLRNCTAYLNAGFGESTEDFLYAGEQVIAQNGIRLKENELALPTSVFCIADLDLSLSHRPEKINVAIKISKKSKKVTHHVQIERLPFLSSCRYPIEKIFQLQAIALGKRLMHTNSKKMILGFSGGLDSTLALLFAIQTANWLQLPKESVIAVSMPGPGTSQISLQHTRQLSSLLGIDAREINIEKAVYSHLLDIEHDPSVLDTTFENAQARERTQILFDLANKESAIVLGTADLSEIILGFTTYNADHMSMYSVNCGIPKSLVKALVLHAAKSKTYNEEISLLLEEIVAKPISPELLPPNSRGEISQKTEEIIASYELIDFFIYYGLYKKIPAKQLLAYALQVFELPAEYLKTVCKDFYKRFIRNQFKRSCMPGGIQLFDFSVSPRAGMKLASDAEAEFLFRDI